MAVLKCTACGSMFEGKAFDGACEECAVALGLKPTYDEHGDLLPWVVAELRDLDAEMANMQEEAQLETSSVGEPVFLYDEDTDTDVED